MKKQRLLLVDGYNVLNAWKGILSGRSLADARDQLVDRLHDYAGVTGQRVIIVFDAWQSDRPLRSVEENGLITVVFTQQKETADHYIERVCDELSEKVRAGHVILRVATSDGVEQTIVMGRGAQRVSSRELLYELEGARGTRRALASSQPGNKKSPLMDRLPADVRQKLEKMRRGE